MKSGRKQNRVARCKGPRCGQEVLWVELEGSRTEDGRPRRLMLNARPSSGGNVALVGLGTARTLKAKEVAAARERGEALYLSHWTTCIDGSQFRKGDAHGERHRDAATACGDGAERADSEAA